MDFLSLDIEGPELEVLETIPWDKVDIRAISVETQFLTAEKKAAIFSLLSSEGFTHLSSLARDDVFVQLSEWGSTARQSLLEVLTRHRPRLCQYFRVGRGQLSTHCRHTWPLDYFTTRIPTIEISGCAMRETCPWTIQVLAWTLKAATHWTNQLSDGCTYITYN